MALPPLYKFLSIEGARPTLQTRSFRHAKPDTFNDKDDLTIQSLFPDDVETTLQKASGVFTSVILKHLDDVPTIGSPKIAKQLAALQALFRANPDAAKQLEHWSANEDVSACYDMDFMNAVAADTVAFVNEFLQGYRVFCVTTRLDSEKMWRDYAGNHTGIVLRVEPHLGKDSHLRLFRPVDYRERRPPLYKDAEDFVVGAFFANKDERAKALIANIICTKTLNWKNEEEYRVVVPHDGPNNEPWDAGCYPQEIPELYLGYKMRVRDVADITKLAKAANPSIAVFQMEHNCVGLRSHRLL